MGFCVCGVLLCFSLSQVGDTFTSSLQGWLQKTEHSTILSLVKFKILPFCKKFLT